MTDDNLGIAVEHIARALAGQKSRGVVKRDAKGLVAVVREDLPRMPISVLPRRELVGT